MVFYPQTPVSWEDYNLEMARNEFQESQILNENIYSSRVLSYEQYQPGYEMSLADRGRGEWLPATALEPGFQADQRFPRSYPQSPVSTRGVVTAYHTAMNTPSWGSVDGGLSESLQRNASLSSGFVTLPDNCDNCDNFGTNAPQPLWNNSWASTVNPPASQNSPPSLSLKQMAAHHIGQDTHTHRGTETDGAHHRTSISQLPSPTRPVKSQPWDTDEEGSTPGLPPVCDDGSPETKSASASPATKTTTTAETSTHWKNRQASRVPSSGFRTSRRTPHFVTEKKYRANLNSHLCGLEALIPQEVVVAAMGGRNAAKRLSKVEVLVLAKRHIEILERQILVLEGDKRALFEDIERLKGARKRLTGHPAPGLDSAKD